MGTLDELIPQYAENKALQDDYKKLCDEENKQIKELMDEGTYETGGYKATKTISKRESLDEDKLLDLLLTDESALPVLTQHGIVKTRKYVDIEALEALMYKPLEDATEDTVRNRLLEYISKCRIVKEVVTLKVSKLKGAKNGKKG